MTWKLKLKEKPFKLYQGDCIKVMRSMPSDSVDCICTDPPYGIDFMSKEWDSFGRQKEIKKDSKYKNKGLLKGYGRGGKPDDRTAYQKRSNKGYMEFSHAWAKEAFRILKPGGYLLSFSGTRTYHWMTVGIEMAGFNCRDMISYCYGSGFPKSQNISKMLDKKAGVERQVLSQSKAVKRMIPGADQDKTGSWIKDNGKIFVPTITLSMSNEAKRFDGYGTALKPAQEPIGVFQKPLSESTIAVNCLKWGTGGINIDAGRITYDMKDTNPATNPLYRTQNGYKTKVGHDKNGSSFKIKRNGGEVTANVQGRWPANFIHDGSPEVLACFPDAKGAVSNSSKTNKGMLGTSTFQIHERSITKGRGDSGSAGRFFYCAKPSTREREAGFDIIKEKRSNDHPTLKPIDLMRYLVSIYCPHDGVVLDPFMGSGTTGIACIKAGKRFIGIEKDRHYCVDIATRRINHHFYYG